MKDFLSDKRYAALFVFIALAVGLIGFKAFNTSFTYDESYTFNHMVHHQSYGDIIAYNNPKPNNHLINSLIIKFFYEIFGGNELILRTPNILALIGYIVFSFLIFSRVTLILILPGSILVVANPYLLDFFGLARGYGLGIFFVMASIHYFLKYIEDFCRWRHYKLALIMASLAMLSNFTLIYFLFSLVIIYNFFLIFDKKRAFQFSNKTLTYQNQPNLYALIPVLYVVLVPIRKFIRKDQLYFGGEANFWSDTIQSLIQSSHYGAHYWLPTKMLTGIMVITVIFASIYFVGDALRKGLNEIKIKRLSVPLLLILILALITTVNHYLFGTKFIIQRTALFLYPVFILNLVFLIDVLAKKPKSILIYLGYGLAIVFLGHTANAFTFHYYHDWQYDAYTKNVVQSIKQKEKPESGEKVRLGISWLFGPTINFYKRTDKLEWLEMVNKNEFNANDDYFYTRKKDLPALDTFNKTLIKQYPLSNSYLYKNEK